MEHLTYEVYEHKWPQECKAIISTLRVHFARYGDEYAAVACKTAIDYEADLRWLFPAGRVRNIYTIDPAMWLWVVLADIENMP